MHRHLFFSRQKTNFNEAFPGNVQPSTSLNNSYLQHHNIIHIYNFENTSMVK